MRHRSQVIAACVSAFVGVALPSQTLAGQEQRRGVVFEPNVGQFDSDVRFASHGDGYTLFVTDAGAVVTIRDRARSMPDRSTRSATIRLSFGSIGSGATSGLDPQTGVINYLIGNDPLKWHTGIRTYARVTRDEVYPGIDLVYYGRDGRHEYDFVVAPGADPARIAMRVTGADRLDLNGEGNLLLATVHGTITLKAPHVYQVVDGTPRVVAAQYTTDRSNTVGFDLDAYDRSLPLVIDPQIVYGTFLGGSGDGVDQLAGVDLDATGAAYIVGSTDNADYPTESPIQPRRGSGDAVITKIAADGRLIYSTYLGGSGSDGGQDIAVRADGTAYVLGSTSSADFPLPGAFQRELRGGGDVFVVELSKDGASVVRGTLLGGGGSDAPGGLKLAQAGDDVSSVFGDWVFVYGSTTSPDFPLVEALQSRRVGERDGFVTVFDRLTLQPGFSTYLGQEGSNLAEELVLNRARGDAYLWLYRSDDVGPLLVHLKPGTQPAAGVSRPLVSFQNVFSGYVIGQVSTMAHLSPLLLDTFLLQLKTARANSCTPEEDAFVRTTILVCKAALYFQGQAADGSRPLATTTELQDAVLTVVVTGCLPFAPATSCTERAAVLLFDADMKFITHINFGGTRVGRDFTVSRMVADREGRFHFIGTTSDRTLPVVNPVQGAHAGSSEGFILTLDPRSGETTFLSYLGGASFETMNDIAVDKDGNRWIVGSSQSSDFPTTRSGKQPDLRGRIDGFVVKIAP